MGHDRRTTGWTARALLLSLALAPRPHPAGEWHRDASLRCSDCHTMHNSIGGQPMRYDLQESPALLLLRAADATALCLACHSGTRPSVSAPNVMAPSSWDPPGGGFPADLADPGHLAHSLGSAPVLPPWGDTEVAMGCVTCHSPHGTSAYRNLVTSPSGTGRATAPPTVNQLVTAGGGNPDQVYVRSNVVYVTGLSAWCLDCHNLITPGHSNGAEAPAHPWDRTIFGSTQTDWDAWTGTIVNRTAVENPIGAPPPDTADRVFCLSCHKAHGSPNPAALVYADGVTMSSTCQQCHNM
jgi:predicted CXXCH cytochrome family protein